MDVLEEYIVCSSGNLLGFGIFALYHGQKKTWNQTTDTNQGQKILTWNDCTHYLLDIPAPEMASAYVHSPSFHLTYIDENAHL